MSSEPKKKLGCKFITTSHIVHLLIGNSNLELSSLVKVVKSIEISFEELVVFKLSLGEFVFMGGSMTEVMVMNT